MHLPRTIKEWRRSLGNLLVIQKNRLMGRSFVPIPRSAISIETSARCNLACRFCAYPKRGPGNFMTMERFSNSVEQACENGISKFCLTPMLGEVFADPNWIEKFQFWKITKGWEASISLQTLFSRRPIKSANSLNLRNCQSCISAFTVTIMKASSR